jgi:hypothetical protein
MRRVNGSSAPTCEEVDTVEPTFPPSEPGRHGIADVLRPVDQLRAVAFDRTLADYEIARRIRDAIREHDGE